MTYRYAIALAALFGAAPALATGGYECRTTDGSDIEVSGTVGHVVGNPLVGARLSIAGRTLSTGDEEPGIGIAQSWIDAREIRLDLVDGQATRFEAQLRVRVSRPGTAQGTLLREGRSHPIVCTIA